MFRKLLKISHYIPLEYRPCAFSSSHSQDAWLCALPTEILAIIFSYLPPQSLVSIRELGIQRFTEISLSLKKADFSECNTVRIEYVSSFFTKDRVDHIKEISFDNVFFLNPLSLEKYIIKCKHLTVLSVVECRISFANIFCILKNCSEFEELYWNLYIKKTVPDSDRVFENVKKLYLHIEETRRIEFVVINKMLKMCPKAHDVCLNFSPYFSRTLPHEIARSVQTGRIFYKNREHPVSIVTCTELSGFFDGVRNLMDKLCYSDQRHVENVFITGEDMSFYICNYSSYLQFITDEKDMAMLSSVPDNSVHSLVVIMNERKAQLLNHIEEIKKVTGLKLKHLTLRSTSTPSTSMRDGIMPESSDGGLMCDILSRIVSNALNISVLNLSELHYDNLFPFSALYCLKQLKVFSMSACCLKKNSANGSAFDFYEDQIKKFEGFIENCQNVEKFSLLSCLRCTFGPDDRGLAPVHKWKKLKAFTIKDVESLRVCPFLRHIAYNCPDFQSLELSAIGNKNVCHYTPNVIQIIMCSEKLLFLRINQPRFYPSDHSFWHSLESARNLQGICITTMSGTHLENRIIVDPLRKLPFLHVFHLVSPYICQNLPTQVKQIIAKNHNLHSYSIHVSSASDRMNTYCRRCHFPTF